MPAYIPDEYDQKLALLEESLHLGGCIYVHNKGSGMRRLFRAGDLIRVSKSNGVGLMVGQILLYRASRMFFGGRVVALADGGGYMVKSDCGRGAAREVGIDKVVGVVDAVQIGSSMYQLGNDETSRKLDERIARYSVRIVPLGSLRLFLSGRWGELCRRKLLLVFLRRCQRKLILHLSAKHPVKCPELSTLLSL